MTIHDLTPEQFLLAMAGTTLWALLGASLATKVWDLWAQDSQRRTRRNDGSHK